MERRAGTVTDCDESYECLTFILWEKYTFFVVLIPTVL
jgi:hypothetical protein